MGDIKSGDTESCDTKAFSWFGRNLSDVPSHVLRIGAVTLAIGFVMAAGAARAQDAEDEDKTFEEKIIDNVMAGIGATNMDNRGIDYRERSPLVVPPRLDLPPPASATQATAPNWPKDPDEARRKVAIARRKKENKDPIEAARPLTHAELDAARTAAPTGSTSQTAQPGSVGNTENKNVMLSPSQLGFDGRFSSLFKGNKSEEAPFKGEPTRDSLTQPPPGYQTPSSNFAYGTGPKDSLNKEYNPAAGKYGE